MDRMKWNEMEDLRMWKSDANDFSIICCCGCKISVLIGQAVESIIHDKNTNCTTLESVWSLKACDSSLRLAGESHYSRAQHLNSGIAFLICLCKYAILRQCWCGGIAMKQISFFHSIQFLLKHLNRVRISEIQIRWNLRCNRIIRKIHSTDTNPDILFSLN